MVTFENDPVIPQRPLWKVHFVAIFHNCHGIVQPQHDLLYAILELI